ncbi:unnamed protein product [Ceratitis capitata]|uniref:(Mediterranean fruit fly) hypothetical protein n=1 Tax=Ceratitis capitata TaxID=7213 RepID=A0A811VDA3_CERCA|nr:unnamed protein product [Ceratitis capitata]
MQTNKHTIFAIFLCIAVLTLQQQCDAKPAQDRETRQAKGPSNVSATQVEVKSLGGQLLASGGVPLLTQPQALSGQLPGFGYFPIARYGGAAYGGSGYVGAPGMGLIGGYPLSGSGSGLEALAGAGNGISTGGVNTLQFGNLAGLGHPATANYVGNSLPPYPLNGPDMFTNYMFGGLPQMQNNFGPTVGGASNLENIVNAANLPGVIGSVGQTPFVGAQAQLPQLQLQGQVAAAQAQPQFGHMNSIPSGIFGPAGGYGPGLQGFQLF